MVGVHAVLQASGDEEVPQRVDRPVADRDLRVHEQRGERRLERADRFPVRVAEDEFVVAREPLDPVQRRIGALQADDLAGSCLARDLEDRCRSARRMSAHFSARASPTRMPVFARTMR